MSTLLLNAPRAHHSLSLRPQHGSSCGVTRQPIKSCSLGGALPSPAQGHILLWRLPRRMGVVRASPQPQPSSAPGLDDGGKKLTAVARVDVGYAVEQLNVPISAPSNQVLTATLTLPMGLVIEEVDGLFQVVEVTPGSSAWENKVCVGDVVRGLTAASMQMTYPTMNLMFGGVGRPKLARVAVPATGKPFAWLRDAIRSNSQLPGPPTVTLILERQGQAPLEVEVKQAQGQQLPDTTTSVFDPSIFE